MVLKSCKPKVFKSGKTFKSSWRPYNSQFYADGTPKTRAMLQKVSIFY